VTADYMSMEDLRTRYGTFYSIEQMAQLTRRLLRQVHRWIADGKLNVIHLPSGGVLIPQSEVDRWIAPLQTESKHGEKFPPSVSRHPAEDDQPPF